ncbi:MAG: hypothetical protein ABFQ53_02945 [Patescibacteria group bacterium]
MNVYLFNCRPLKILPGLKSVNTGTLTIYTAFEPKSLICSDLLFLTESIKNSPKKFFTRCIYIQDTPKILEPKFDHELLQEFERLIKAKKFLSATLTEETAQNIRATAVTSSSQSIIN